MGLMRRKIASKLKNSEVTTKPWHDAFPKELAVELAENFGFLDGYDLAQELNEAVWRFKRRNERKAPARRKELEAALKSGEAPNSYYGSVTTALWILAHPREAKRRSPEKIVMAAMADGIRDHKRPGRRPDLPRIALYRTLARIYANGTGKTPRVTGRDPDYRGEVFEFAKAVCEHLGIPAVRLLRDEIKTWSRHMKRVKRTKRLRKAWSFFVGYKTE